MFDINDCIGFITNHGAKTISESMNDRFREQSVTRVQWTALYYIHENPYIMQKQLAKKMMTREPTIVHLVDRLEHECLVRREIMEPNRRMNILKLTERGEEVFHAVLQVAKKFNQDAIQGIADEDLCTFKRVLDQMIANVTDFNDPFCQDTNSNKTS